MAIRPAQPRPSATPPISATSDYGSDIDDADADVIFSQIESQRLYTPVKSPLQREDSQKEAILPSTEQPLLVELEEDVYSHNLSVRMARLRQSLDGDEESRARLEGLVREREQRREAGVEVEYDERNRREFSPSNAEEPTTTTPEPLNNGGKKSRRKDTRTPLQRFKSYRPLSVTNLVSPTWCEQQYEYNLSNYGRIPKTKAMAAGSSVHKVLEEQVHVEVPVEVVTREDRFGLKLWNTIQGLRALRETGLTRELEIWGVLEGQVINGIVDEVSIECSDVAMEERILDQLAGGSGAKSKKQPQLAPDQRTLTDFLTGPLQGGSILEASQKSNVDKELRDRPHATYYIKDIKTTARASPPAHGPYTRGAHMQLMLYHRILSQLASDAFSAEQVFARYRLDGNMAFSDKFIAELADLDMRAFVSVPDDADIPASSQPWQADSLAELLERNSLSKLWTLLAEECRRTFPSTSSPSGAAASFPSISPLLTVEYRASYSRKAAPDALLGTRSFPMDSARLDGFVKSEMAWWKGERATVGVSVEEAWKCERCEFRESCTWRMNRVEEGLERARLRREGRGRSGV